MSNEAEQNTGQTIKQDQPEMRNLSIVEGKNVIVFFWQKKITLKLEPSNAK